MTTDLVGGFLQTTTPDNVIRCRLSKASSGRHGPGFQFALSHISSDDFSVDSDGADEITTGFINNVDKLKVWGLRPHAPPLTMSVV